MTTAEAVAAVIHAQAAAWNRNDVDGFVSTVAENVVYVTPMGLLRGREALLDAYQGSWSRHPGGQLTVEVELVLDHGDAATAVVRYWLAHSRDDRSGWSLLTFVRADERWLLAADASMREWRGQE